MTREEALEEIKTWDFLNEREREAIEAICPELKETKDERIKKLLQALIEWAKSYSSSGITNDQAKDMLDWLEKWKYTQMDVDNAYLRGVEVSKAMLKQKKLSIKVYRVENEKEQRGLWRRFDGTWDPMFDQLTDGQCKDMPMDDDPLYREDGKKWFASAPSKETLQKWFSKRDLEELVANGFTISEFEVTGYKRVSDYEYIFTRDNIISSHHFTVADIYPSFKVGDRVR